MTITTNEELQGYLKSNDIAFRSIQQLSGGTANFVWRLIDPSGHSSIIKHAEPFIKDIRDMPFSVDRMDFEAHALQALPRLLGTNDLIYLPKVHHYDSSHHVLHLSDGGPRTLKDAYTDRSLDVQYFGKRLGQWLASLHALTTAIDLGGKDNITAKKIYRYSYANLSRSLAQHGLDPSLGLKVNEEYGSLLDTDDTSICHGDFWPGNVLVDVPTTADGSSQPPRLTIVDWEMTRRGYGATDVGQFAAEAFMLDRFRGARGLLKAFLEGYAGVAGEVELRFVQRVAVQFGTHIAFFPTMVHWGTPEETRALAVVGVEVIERAMREDWGWLRGSMLGDIVSATATVVKATEAVD